MVEDSAIIMYLILVIKSCPLRFVISRYCTSEIYHFPKDLWRSISDNVGTCNWDSLVRMSVIQKVKPYSVSQPATSIHLWPCQDESRTWWHDVVAVSREMITWCSWLFVRLIWHATYMALDVYRCSPSNGPMAWQGLTWPRYRSLISLKCAIQMYSAFQTWAYLIKQTPRHIQVSQMDAWVHMTEL